jgi:hypothetical protein
MDVVYMYINSMSHLVERDGGVQLTCTVRQAIAVLQVNTRYRKGPKSLS